jgi:hypothetical protein
MHYSKTTSQPQANTRASKQHGNASGSNCGLKKPPSQCNMLTSSQGAVKNDGSPLQPSACQEHSIHKHLTQPAVHCVHGITQLHEMHKRITQHTSPSTPGHTVPMPLQQHSVAHSATVCITHGGCK